MSTIPTRRDLTLIFIATACTAASLMALAADFRFPHLKPGLWLHVRTHSGYNHGEPFTTRICVDASTDQATSEWMVGTRAEKLCTKDVQLVGNKVIVNSVCPQIRPQVSGRITSHSVTTFYGDRATHSEFEAHYRPPWPFLSDDRSTDDGKWVGPCPADMAPGDAISESPKMPSAMRFNLLTPSTGQFPSSGQSQSSGPSQSSGQSPTIIRGTTISGK
jgi:hypothetical protein